jgi:hypothetical protein
LTVGFLGRVIAEKFSADRNRRLVARRRFDALPAKAVGKRFIAGVGGYAAAPLPTTSPRNGVPPAVALSFSLPMMRSATSHTASIAPTISCLPTTTSCEACRTKRANRGLRIAIGAWNGLDSAPWRLDAMAALWSQHLNRWDAAAGSGDTREVRRVGQRTAS